MRKAYLYRLYPTDAQALAAQGQLALACELYNACLEEHREAYHRAGKSLSYYDQADQLKDIRRIRPDLGLLNFSMLQATCRRVQRSFENFFRRVKAGETPGYPRFRSARRWDSITFPSYGDGCKVADSRLYLQGIGRIKVKLHRPIEGTIKTVTLKRSCGKWYVVFSCDLGNAVPAPCTAPAVGIDLGLKAFLVTSDGAQVAPPKLYRAAQAHLRRVARRVVRRKKGSTRRKKAVTVLVKVHEHVANQRRDFHHKTARVLVEAQSLIAVEALQPANMSRRPKPQPATTEDGQVIYLPNGATAKAGLNKSILDAGWGGFLELLSSKAEGAGCLVVKINPAGTSQTCSGCGAACPKSLSTRWHHCEHCGCSLQRDVNAAKNMLRAGQALQARA